jgi:hypothetical protein
VRPYLKNIRHKKGLEEWLKVKALNSSSSTAKKKKGKSSGGKKYSNLKNSLTGSKADLSRQKTL